jgi:hypothetical protein
MDDIHTYNMFMSCFYMQLTHRLHQTFAPFSCIHHSFAFVYLSIRLDFLFVTKFRQIKIKNYNYNNL